MARRKKSADFDAILEKIPQEKKHIAQRLIDELLFMQDTLTDLKAKIRENGTTEQFIQGKQNFTREAPALTAYNKTIAQYSKLYKQLSDLIPKVQEAEKSNAVYDFLKDNAE